MKRSVRATSLSMGAALAVSLGILTQPATGTLAQQIPTPPSPVASPAASPVAPLPAAKPAASPAASPVSTAPAPRAGGFPVGLALPLLAGGAAATGAGAYLLRRRRS
ncbi:MAG: hypothetical protein IT305_22460 [Chloroflexi bacterium]|nr:hypothetical protein [Chloroflexota bacterium]